MKLRQAKKIVRRIVRIDYEYRYLGKPLPKSYRKIARLYIKALVQVNRISILGREQNVYMYSTLPTILKKNKYISYGKF